MHEGKIKPEDLNVELIRQTYKDLSSGAKDGFGKSWETKYSKKGDETVVTELKKNLYTFAGAKSYAMLETANKMLYTQDGKMRPFNEYSQLVRKVNAQYNKHWLQAEYQTARAAAQMANKWQKIQAEKELFPSLRYRTTGDGKVRDEHVMLNGVVKPIDDPFWGIYYPPNGWRCRCDVVQTAEKATQDKITDFDAPDMPGNVGADEEIFTNNHKFFKLLKTNDRAVRNNELMKLNAPYDLKYENKKGKKLRESIFADKNGISQNRESATLVIDNLNLNVTIEAHLNGRIIKNHKNAEYKIEGKKADLKTPDKSSYKNVLKKAAAQNCEYVVVNLGTNKDTIDSARHLIRNILKHKNVHLTIKKVIIISKNNEVSIYKRDEI